MSETILRIKYECQHPSCQVFCKSGEVLLEKDYFAALDEDKEGEGIFKSPKAACRMGFAQPFKVLSITEEDLNKEEELEPEELVTTLDFTNPVALLRKEHEQVIKVLEVFEYHLKKRDIPALWLAATDLENEILLHSINKEEQGLFPVIAGKVPMIEAYMNIVLEDHKEFLSLLHSFRCGLQVGNIYDGIIHSVIVNLRSHILKENGEFFKMLEDKMTAEDKALVIERMAKLEAAFVPTLPGDINEEINSPFVANRNQLDSEFNAARGSSSTNDWGCCH